jgi:hypothetical protein
MEVYSMALLWVEGFEKFGAIGTTINTIDTNWDVLQFKYLSSNTSTINIVAGRYDDGAAIEFNDPDQYLQTPDLNTTNTTMFAGFSFKIPTLSAGARLCDFRTPTNDGSTTSDRSLAVAVTSGGELNVIRGTTTLATSSGANIQSDTWYHAEIKVKCASSGGNVTVRLDESEEINYNGNTQFLSGFCYSRLLWRSATSDTLVIDDAYIFDATGSAVNDFLGECRIETLTPISDASGNWTASTGSDLYAMVDEDKLNAEYISDTATGNQAIFETTNMCSECGTGIVQGVMVSCDSQQYGTTPGRFKKYAKMITQNGSGGSIQDSGVFMPGQSYPLTFTQVMETDPDGSPWIPATVNSFRVGVEVS